MSERVPVLKEHLDTRQKIQQRVLAYTRVTRTHHTFSH